MSKYKHNILVISHQEIWDYVSIKTREILHYTLEVTLKHKYCVGTFIFSDEDRETIRLECRRKQSEILAQSMVEKQLHTTLLSWDVVNSQPVD